MGSEQKGRPPEGLFRAVFDGAAEAMVLLDDQRMLIDLNPAASTLLGLPPELLLGRCLNDFVSADVDVAPRWQTFLSAGRREGSFAVRRADGSSVDVEFSASANVLPGVHLGVMRDLTEGRRTEARFRAMIEKSDDGISLLTADARTLYQSPAVDRLFGYSAEEASQTPWDQFVVEEDRPLVAEALGRLLARPSASVALGFRVLHRRGDIRWVDLTATNLLHDPSVGALVTNFRDATERKRSDEMRNRLAAIVESSEDAILSLDLFGVIRTWNRGATRLYQYGAEEVLGRPFALLIPREVEGDERAILERIARGEFVEHYETRRRRKDGVLIEVSLTISPVRDLAGRIVGASKIARDLTEQRKDEARLRRIEEQLRQSQKMEAVGRLAGGVAHDFNNLLSVVLSYSNLLIETLPSGDPIRDDLEEIAAAGTRAAAVTQQLLAFSRGQVLQPKVVELNQLLAGLNRMLSRLLGEDIDLTFFTHSQGRVFADPGQIEQVVMNLVVNARDAMPGGGKLTIETADVLFDESFAACHHGAKVGRYVMVAVTDTGEGMDAATRERIFEPFFTTKGPGQGTGLGLSTAFGIVQQSGGHIWVYSEPGVGTTFKVYFPRTERSVEEAAGSLKPPPGSLEGRETILVVEDEDSVRRSLRRILQQRGYDAIEARSGAEALLLCEKFEGKIELLITDVIMPQLSGRELEQRLTATRPGLKVLFISGYTENSIVHHGVLDRGIHFLAKPITPETLLRKVREVLDEPPGYQAPALAI